MVHYGAGVRTGSDHRAEQTIAPRAWWAEPCAVDGRHPALVRRASFDENPVPFAPPCRPAHSSAIAGSDYARSARSEERRVGQECVSTCRSWWSAYDLQQSCTNDITNETQK